MKTEKRCPRCGETKPVSDYYKDTSKSDLLSTMCMCCKRAASSAYYHAHKEARQAYYRDYRAKYGW